MTKRKYPSELNTRTIRVNIEDYSLLVEMAKKSDKTVAEALSSIIKKQAEGKIGDESKG